jgi:hypothetical protein
MQFLSLSVRRREQNINLHRLIYAYLKGIILEGDNSKFLEGCLPLYVID